MMPSICFLIALTITGAVAEPLEKIGQSIHLPFPNDQSIKGVVGLSYNNQNNTNLWLACSDTIASEEDGGEDENVRE